MNKKQILLVSFMLFSLFFGAGNLIFPPLLGALSGKNMWISIIGFVVTAVILPVLGVIVVSKFKGLQNLGKKVHPLFGIVFTFLIYLSIGPGLGIPRAASVPFEMAISPYLPDNNLTWLYLLIFSLVFFAIVYILSVNPKKLVNRIGKVLTPALLILIIFLFVSSLFGQGHEVLDPVGNYVNNPFVQGFLDGYLTMDTIAALNFGLIISNTILSFGVTEEKQTNYILVCASFAGLILTSIYIMLSYLGMEYSSIVIGAENGAVILRAISQSLFGTFGAVLLATIFTLACLTTCIGLVTSISQFFESQFPKIKYKHYVLVITLFSFGICNFGLNTLLKFSVPLLDLIYPISICLIFLGLFDRFYKNNKFIYPVTISIVFLMSFLYVLRTLGVNYGAFGNFLEQIPLFKSGLGWVLFALGSVIVTIPLGYIFKKNEPVLEN